MAKQSPAKAADELINDLDEQETLELAQEQEESERAADPESPAKEVATEATAAPRAKPFVFDDVSGRLVVNDAYGAFECTLMGISPRVSWRLAAIGLAHQLRGRARKAELLKEIQAGNFGGKRRKNYPATVVAIARMDRVTIEEAYEQWMALSSEERMAVRSAPRTRKMLAIMAEEEEAAASQV